MTDEKNYKIKITAGLINSIFCTETGDVWAIITSNDLHQIVPMFRDWMRSAIRHPDGTHMTTEEADAIFDEMPIIEYLEYLREIGDALNLTLVNTTVDTAEDTTEPQESA